ncbi:MAG: hypothetical protein IH987_19895 [Planctomycetes bacterium]|nr:hypothetical protein [Planctomycetota bacterium]
MIFVERSSRSVVANQIDKKGLLKARKGVFVGTLPDNAMVANTATKWAGVEWTMILWPLPTDPQDRARLMAHEMWHRIQNDLGLPAANPANGHLDTRDGRVWLQLEWRALARALSHSGKERREAIEDAVTFRARRHELFPDGAAEEVALEMNEGLAEYTGVVVSAGKARVAARFAIDALGRAPSANETFVRSFAYASGPAYGVLLDDLTPGWRAGLKPTNDLGDLLREAMRMRPLLAAQLQREASRRAKRYDSEKLFQAEDERERNRQKVLAAYRVKFVDGPVLTLPFVKMQIQFNPRNLVPLDDVGTVYPTMRISDAWGILTVTDGGLVDGAWQKAVVAAPVDISKRPLSGDGWELQLNDGWSVKENSDRPTFILERSDP